MITLGGGFIGGSLSFYHNFLFFHEIPIKYSIEFTIAVTVVD